MGELCRRNPLCSLGPVRIQKAHRGALTKTLMDTVPSECLQSPNRFCPREKKNTKSSQSFPTTLKVKVPTTSLFFPLLFSPLSWHHPSWERFTWKKKYSSLLLGRRECHFSGTKRRHFVSTVSQFPWIFFFRVLSWMDEWHRLFCWLVLGR